MSRLSLHSCPRLRPWKPFFKENELEVVDLRMNRHIVVRLRTSAGVEFSATLPLTTSDHRSRRNTENDIIKAMRRTQGEKA